MKRFWIRGLVSCVFVTACVSVTADEPWQTTPEYKFGHELWKLGFHCDAAASRARLARDIPSMSDQATSEALDCLRSSYATARESFPAVIAAEKSPTMKPFLKDLYVKWQTYMSTISVTSGRNEEARQAFQASLNALDVELQTQ